MNKIKIAHLYYDLLNLYGENGNIRCLKRFIEMQDVKCEIHFLSIDDDINFDDYDMFYMGMGTENSLLLVLKDIMKYKDDIKKAIDNKKFFLATGNSIELFGKYITTLDGTKVDALNVFDYYTEWKDFRIVGSVVSKSKLIKDYVIGFQNRCGEMFNVDRSLLSIKEGTGMNLKSNVEGIYYKNFYGTYQVGPLLIRNPHLTNYIIKNLIHSKNKNYKFKIYNRIPEVKAYNTYLDNFNIKNN